MKIAVISDSHRFENYMEIAKRYIEDSDVLIHLGDNADDVSYLAEDYHGEVYAVKGNCDYGNVYSKEQIIEKCGKKIFITHGDLYGVKSGMNNLFYRGLEVGADIVLFGHTHMRFLEEYNGITFLNPGSIALPRLGGRNIGFIELEEKRKPEIYLVDIMKE